MQTKKVQGRSTKIKTMGVETIVYLHDTPVVSFNDARICLNTGGFYTRTTIRRMNQASNQFQLGYRVHQSKGMWFVTFGHRTFEFAESIVYLGRTANTPVFHANGELYTKWEYK